LVLSTKTARFGYPEVKIGFVPAMVMAILRRNTSEKRAFELITLGFEFDAEEAQKFGLVNQIYDEADFEAGVNNYIAAYEKVSRSAVMLSKRLLYQMDNMTFEQSLQAGVDTNTIARLTEDCQTGIAKFLQKK
jgi:methylglutaconyl-CoA hydratase